MTTFFNLYFAWAGPNVIAALVTGTIAWWLLERRKSGGAFSPGWQGQMISLVGVGCVIVVILSAILALLGIQPLAGFRGTIGIVVGIIFPLRAFVKT